MNKRELADVMSERLAIEKYAAYNFIDLLIDVIKEKLESGQKVVFSRFGTLHVKKKMAKRVLNPNNGQPLIMPPRNTVKFIPSRNLKKLVAGGK